MKFQCIKCNGVIAVDDEPGTDVKCGHCKESIKVPQLFAASHVIDDFIIVKPIDEKTFECKQISLDIPVILSILQSSDSNVVKDFIDASRAQARRKKVHALGKDGDVYFSASMI